MEVTFFWNECRFAYKERNTQAIALNLEPYSNSIWLFDVGEGTQHQILHHAIKLGKVTHIFITHMHGDHIFGLPELFLVVLFRAVNRSRLHWLDQKELKHMWKCL